MQTHLRSACLVLVAGAVLAAPARAADAAGVPPKEVKPVADKGIAFLKGRQGDDGSYSGKARGQGPGITALVVAALLRNGVSPDDPMVANALKYLETKVHKDGGIYDQGLTNYITSVAVMALAEANADKKYDKVIANATKFLKKLQIGGDEADVKYGGVGYGNGAKDRPDMSNTQLFLDALLAAGVPKDDPAVQKALKFISRCQNLPGETNDQPFAKKTTEDDKGGLTYVPLDPDDNPHKTPGGGLRSLGGMTYAGLKSFLYAGVKKDDPRVKGAVNWVRRHYTVKENPGMGSAGLYYYYHTFAKALTAWGDDDFADDKGKKHDWRRELFDELKSRQGKDGGWVNEKRDQFGEGNPDIATAFALLALSYTLAAKK